MDHIESTIYGMLLGDSSISVTGKSKTPHVVTQHGAKQLKYLLCKRKMLGHTGKVLRRTTGYGFSAFRFTYYNSNVLHEAYDTCVVGGVKTITRAWLEKLNDLSIALWYQDDGSWGCSGKRTKIGGRGQRYSQFHVQGFDYNSQVMLTEWLRSLGYSASLKDHKGKYKLIQLNHTSTKKLWTTVAPYLVLDQKIDLIRGDVDKCKCGKNKLHSQNHCDECLYNLVISLDDVPRRERGNVSKVAGRRFGTSSAKTLKEIAPSFCFPSEYRIDPLIVGKRVKQYVPTSEEMEPYY